MALQLVEDEFGDPRNALFLATASNLAYEPKEIGERAFREELGLEATLYGVVNSQTYVGANAEHIVVAYRGTEAPSTLDGVKDMLLNDARNLLIVPEGRLGTDFIAAGVGARMHQGFINGLADTWDPVFERITAEMKASERPLWLTGHSLGGAGPAGGLAVLAPFRQRPSDLHLRRPHGWQQDCVNGFRRRAERESLSLHPLRRSRAAAPDDQLAGKRLLSLRPRDCIRGSR